MNPYLDPETITVGELAVLEEFTGYTLEDTLEALTEGRWSESATFLVACLFVVEHRADPDATVESVSGILFADLLTGVADAIEQAPATIPEEDS